MKEIKKRIYKGKGKYGHAWLLLKAGIVRIVDVKMETASSAFSSSAAGASTKTSSVSTVANAGTSS